MNTAPLSTILAVQQGLPVTSLQWLLLELAKSPHDQYLLSRVKERTGLADHKQVTLPGNAGHQLIPSVPYSVASEDMHTAL